MENNLFRQHNFFLFTNKQLFIDQMNSGKKVFKYLNYKLSC